MSAFKDGDILLCKGKGFIPWLIQWGTGSIYSHVAVVASAKLNLVIEAVPQGGVRAIYIKSITTEFDTFRIKEGLALDTLGVTTYLITLLARRYDYRAVSFLGSQLVIKRVLRRARLAKLFFLKIFKQKSAADRLQEDQDYFCSELCYKAFKFGGGLDIVPQIDSGETTSPGDISEARFF